MRTRRATRAQVSTDGDELESWLHDLVGGEASARRYRERLRTEGATAEDSYSCRDAERLHDSYTA